MMTQRIPGYIKKQLAIPGLESLEKAATVADRKRKTYDEQLKALQSRILTLELEVSLLRIQIEKGAGLQCE